MLGQQDRQVQMDRQDLREQQDLLEVQDLLDRQEQPQGSVHQQPVLDLLELLRRDPILLKCLPFQSLREQLGRPALPDLREQMVVMGQPALLDLLDR
jgi:hypothetical protein